ncbi:MAG: 2-oxoacid:acceptor oxidoreductase family protein, partial [Bacteroidales bacterium]|nr:2-oxoacid:acceptor oxidoreductase family protein [Bacteroidales bacterium]
PSDPEAEALQAALDAVPNKVVLDVEAIAQDCGSARSANMVLLGAATPFLHLSYESIEEGIRAIFARKGQDIVDKNIAALRAGKAVAEQR